MTVMPLLQSVVEPEPAWCRALDLGATLYVPATRSDRRAVAEGQRVPGLRSLVWCLEDAVRPEDLPAALAGIAEDLPLLAGSAAPRPHLFLRPRDVTMLEHLLELPGIQAVAGFVLPKLDRRSLGAWRACLGDRHGFQVMPVLETAEVLEATTRRRLRKALEALPWIGQIPALRIGGNDLLRILGLRRPAQGTLYDGPLKVVIADLACCFLPAGFALTGPVFERFDRPADLAAEVALDLAHGLTGKTAVHPRQVAEIHHALRPLPAEAAEATLLLAPHAPAVFALQGAMGEPATHAAWAERVRVRAALYGVRE